MGTTVAYLADCQGSASIEEQKGCLAPDDHVLIAGRHSFAKLEDLLTEHSLTLSAGDRIKVYDLSCITLSTTTLIRLITRLLGNGVTFEIASLGIVVRPDAEDRLHQLLRALDTHYRHVHGVKIHAAESPGRGRKRLIDPDQLTDIRARLDEPGATATEVAQELGVARSTLFNFLERYDRDRRSLRDKKPVKGCAEDAGDNAHVAETESNEGSS